MERRGPRSKLTRAVLETILQAKRNGRLQHEAAQDAGIDRVTMHRWLQRGKNGEQPYDAFADAYYACEKQNWDRQLDEIRKAATAS